MRTFFSYLIDDKGIFVPKLTEGKEDPLLNHLGARWDFSLPFYYVILFRNVADLSYAGH